MRTGVDIVEIKRIERILDSRRDTFYRKVFTNNEIAYLESKKHNPKTVSGLFAAKEAVAKALGTGIGVLAWKDIEVSHDKLGRPFIDINSKIKDLLSANALEAIEISISHERHYAISFAIGF